jgi:hypothetical protein
LRVFNFSRVKKQRVQRESGPIDKSIWGRGVDIGGFRIGGGYARISHAGRPATVHYAQNAGRTLDA